jgi:hypothetical protein
LTEVRNFNRRPLRLKRARVSIPSDLLVWHKDDNDPDTIREIIAAARRPGGASFEINQILEGVSPNASSPSVYDYDFRVGLEGRSSDDRRTVELSLVIEWEFASGDALPQTEKHDRQSPDWDFHDDFSSRWTYRRVLRPAL